MSPLPGTDRAALHQAVLHERWRAIGALVYRVQPPGNGLAVLDATGTSTGADLEAARARVVAAAPVAASIVLKLIDLSGGRPLGLFVSGIVWGLTGVTMPWAEVEALDRLGREFAAGGALALIDEEGS